MADRVKRLASIRAYGEIRDGKLSLARRHELDTLLAEIKEVTPIVLTIESLRAFRSRAQNDYYWACVVKPLSDYFGEPPLAVHEMLRVMFNSEPKILVNQQTGQVTEVPGVPRSTRAIKKDEWFEKYIEPIQRWAAQEYGIVIPDPNQMWMLEGE